MTVRQPRYRKEEHARRGMEIYERQVRGLLEAGNEGRIVAIDVDSGDFEVADDMIAAATALLARHADGQFWHVRIGQGPVHRFGPRVGTRPA